MIGVGGGRESGTERGDVWDDAAVGGGQRAGTQRVVGVIARHTCARPPDPVSFRPPVQRLASRARPSTLVRHEAHPGADPVRPLHS